MRKGQKDIRDDFDWLRIEKARFQNNAQWVSKNLQEMIVVGEQLSNARLLQMDERAFLLESHECRRLSCAGPKRQGDFFASLEAGKTLSPSML